MLDCLLYRLGRAPVPSFYRVEIAMNLFSEVSVLREWGLQGGKPRMAIRCYGNLRDASRAADDFRQKALRRGYIRADHASA